MKLKYWIITFVLWIIFFRVFIQYPSHVETFYTNGFYLYLSKGLNTVTSLFPFSIGDVLYSWVGLYLIYKIILIFKIKKGIKDRTLKLSSLLLKSCIGFYILFNIGWGLNNYRTSIESQLGIKKGYNQEQLIHLTSRLIKQANTLQLNLTKNPEASVYITKDIETILNDAKTGVQNIQSIHQKEHIEILAVKRSLLYSLPLTYMGFSGYINPFTLEAQVNSKIPTLTMIVTASHEISHQLGYAKESDANFIGFIAAYQQKELEYQYAAVIYALRYCVSNINEKESDNIQTLFNTIHPGVKNNLNENIIFWSSYKNITDSFFKMFYNNFLKLNNQKEGMESYNKFVDLLINYDLKNNIVIP